MARVAMLTTMSPNPTAILESIIYGDLRPAASLYCNLEQLFAIARERIVNAASENPGGRIHAATVIPAATQTLGNQPCTCSDVKFYVSSEEFRRVELGHPRASYRSSAASTRAPAEAPGIERSSRRRLRLWSGPDPFRWGRSRRLGYS
jgi:hypothetical protein